MSRTTDEIVNEMQAIINVLSECNERRFRTVERMSIENAEQFNEIMAKTREISELQHYRHQYQLLKDGIKESMQELEENYMYDDMLFPMGKLKEILDEKGLL